MFSVLFTTNRVSSEITVISNPKKLYINKTAIKDNNVFQNLLNLKSINQTPCKLTHQNQSLLVYHNLCKLKPYLNDWDYHQAYMPSGRGLF